MTQPSHIQHIQVAFQTSGVLYREFHYVGGKLHGVSKWYYESGALRCEVPYVKGKEHGVVRYYIKSGTLCKESTYVNGKFTEEKEEISL